MITVENEVKVYEVDGRDTAIVDCPTIRVVSHWNHNDRVTLVVDGKKLTVLARDISAAISNATNIARF